VEDIRLIVDLVTALGIALAGGLVARRFGVPVLVGYILAGIVVGPHSPGLAADAGRVELMANLGVAFLMFALGVEFSLAQLMAVRRVAFVAGSIQFPLTILLGIVIGEVLGWDHQASILLGVAFMVSSSIVMIKLTLGRGEAASPYARAALGLGVLQDISLVPLLALLPLLEEENGGLLLTLTRSVGAAIIALVLVIVLGTRLVPRIFFYVARTGSRELFLLTIVVIALGTAYVSHQAGLSFALGAFLAGLVVSESEFDAHVLAEIIPLRDLFSTLFFVSLGMLMEPTYFLRHPGMLIAVLVALVCGKTLAAGIGFALSGIGPVVATKAALLTSQIGEFSFVLASIGLSHAILDDGQYSLILGIALASILVSPFLLFLAPALTPLFARFPSAGDDSLARIDAEADFGMMRRHVIICGYGRVGRALEEALTRRGLGFVVIDLNPATVHELQSRGIPALYGDSTAEPVLHRAGAHAARAMAVTIPNFMVNAQTTRLARRMNSGIDIITRAARFDELQDLRDAGANEVVQPEFEAGLEFVRHVLRRQGVPAREALAVVGRRRALFYRPDEADGVFQEES
jgi:monovalent cation:H+ antiporter-2, CPA2 family